MEKSFFNCLYTSSTLLEALHGYYNPMLNNPNPIKRMKAKRLLSFYGLLTDTKFFGRVQSTFALICKEIDHNFPSVSYELSGRIKALISLINKAEEIEEDTRNNKINEFVEKLISDGGDTLDTEIKVCFPNNDVDLNVASNKEKFTKHISSKIKSVKKTEEAFTSFLSEQIIEPNPFNRIRDFFAFRIVIEDEKVGDLIKEMYDIANMLMHVFDERSEFELLPSQKPIQTGELEISPDLIYVPKESGIEKKYQTYVKDYVMSPKRDGYQGLHIVIYDPRSNRDFEIQIRTRTMDIIAETVANHGYYKKKRYHNRMQEIQEKIDYSRIKIKGFRYFKYIDPLTKEPKDYTSDKAGIVKAIPIRMDAENFGRIIS